ncbi:hypothetical protein WS62_20400 [Burkholderia sp. ABCPW 14]|uniref:Negative regulator of flagellin synthesis n=1 Tax=Burkholderia mayonis TaxID=1385591 RepID=A0A1B4FQR1_9BURK|nr:MULTISPECIES: flagellar biosynthesis anti-sigma factor FlgM [Burkholderia]AOJ05998.1 hypothetical protein WS71_00655 [Burkholderia mayonis]KVD84405.1 hypothetical protein WS62_20400 [Burkholderia sp. ABCPW 14]KVE56935.1 hypothetical protein WS71_02590 [Burkholderia mayonis]
MRLSGTKSRTQVQRVGGAAASGAPKAVAPAPPVERRDEPGEAAALVAARTALRAMPDFDDARVAELRAALHAGRIPFDAAKLAGLIEQFHGAKR